MSLVEVRSLEHLYSVGSSHARRALTDVSLDVEAGEYLALIGANGSGKSTLALHLNGLLLPTSGSVRIDGLDTRESRNLPAVRRTVGIVFQKPEEQIVALTVEEDVAFGPENLRLPRDEVRSRVTESLRRAGLAGFEKRSPHKLSAGQKQRLALAGVLALQPSVVVFDEPTSMLDPEGRAETLALMSELKRSGKAVIHITQRMDEAAEAQRIVILDGGRVVLDGDPRTVFSSTLPVMEALGRPPAMELAEALCARGAENLGRPLSYRELAVALSPLLTSGLAGRLRGALPSAEPGRAEIAAGDGAESLISVERLAHSYARRSDDSAAASPRSLDGVSLSVGRGRFVVLIGETGSGKSTLLQHLNGLFVPQEGRVRIEGVDVSEGAPSLAVLRRRIGLVFQRPEEQIFERYVGDEVAFGPRMAGIAGKPLTERVRWAMELVGLPFEEFKDRMSFALSGGEQRKVGIASILALRPSVLLLDEPAAGLDPPARRHLLELLSNLRAQGTTVVASTHDMELAAELADQVVVLSRGRVVFAGSASAVFSRGDELRSIGLAPPESFDFWSELWGADAAVAGPSPVAPKALLDELTMLLGLTTAAAGTER